MLENLKKRERKYNGKIVALGLLKQVERGGLAKL
jgi:hypothetical protein